jgi:hypothetical protein
VCFSFCICMTRLLREIFAIFFAQAQPLIISKHNSTVGVKLHMVSLQVFGLKNGLRHINSKLLQHFFNLFLQDVVQEHGHLNDNYALTYIHNRCFNYFAFCYDLRAVAT